MNSNKPERDFENTAKVLKVLLNTEGLTRDAIQKLTLLRVHDINTEICYLLQKGILKKIRHTKGKVKNYCYYIKEEPKEGL